MSKATGIKHCILVVDDDDDVLFLMKQTLQSHGYNTTISPNGENIMDIITQSPPDMILLDIQMKGIDGGTVCQLIKTNKSTADIPILMFSSNENIANITKQCGADGYIKKPFEEGKFNEAIQHILNPTKIN
jgi:CheY-like chemotaxis protein